MDNTDRATDIWYASASLWKLFINTGLSPAILQEGSFKLEKCLEMKSLRLKWTPPRENHGSAWTVYKNFSWHQISPNYEKWVDKMVENFRRIYIWSWQQPVAQIWPSYDITLVKFNSNSNSANWSTIWFCSYIWFSRIIFWISLVILINNTVNVPSKR